MTPKRHRLCVICGARIRNMNLQVDTCSHLCLHRKLGTPAKPPRLGTCWKCGGPARFRDLCGACRLLLQE